MSKKSLLNFGFTMKTTKEKKKSKGQEQTKKKYEKKKRVRHFLLKWKDTGEIDTALSSSSYSGVLASAVIGPLDIAVRNLNESQRLKLEACFNTAYFVTKKEFPFTLYPSLLDLQLKNGVDLPNSYHSDQACRRFTDYIYNDIQKSTFDLLKNAKVLSIIFDGTTDVPVSGNEIVYARAVDAGVPKNVFVKINSAEHAHDESIATGSDGASVNYGKPHSVAKLLKDQVSHLVAMHCVNHRLELGALDAMKDRDAKVFC